MRALGYFLLVPTSIVIYFILATELGIYQRYPVIPFLVMAVGIVLLVRLILQKFTIWRLLLNIGAVALAVLFTWWTLGYSSYPELESPVSVGNVSVDALSIEAKNSAGETTTLASAMGDADVVLVSFYRGFW